MAVTETNKWEVGRGGKKTEEVEWSIMGKKQFKKKKTQRKGKEFETITGSNYVCT